MSAYPLECLMFKELNIQTIAHNTKPLEFLNAAVGNDKWYNHFE